MIMDDHYKSQFNLVYFCFHSELEKHRPLKTVALALLSSLFLLGVVRRQKTKNKGPPGSPAANAKGNTQQLAHVCIPTKFQRQDRAATRQLALPGGGMQAERDLCP